MQHKHVTLCLTNCCAVVCCVVGWWVQAKVPFIAAHGWVVALLAKYSTKKLGFDIHKFW